MAEACAICGGELEAARRLRCAGELFQVCHMCARCLSAVPRDGQAAARACLHVAAMELERVGECCDRSSMEWRAVAAILRAVRRSFDLGEYRRRCPCSTCRSCAGGAWGERWGEAVDWLTGEWLPAYWLEGYVPEVRRKLLPDERAALVAHNRVECGREGLSELAAAAIPAKRREAGAWRFPLLHRYLSASAAVQSGAVATHGETALAGRERLEDPAGATRRTILAMCVVEGEAVGFLRKFPAVAWSDVGEADRDASWSMDMDRAARFDGIADAEAAVAPFLAVWRQTGGGRWVEFHEVVERNVPGAGWGVASLRVLP